MRDQRQQNSTSHSVALKLVSSTDNVTPAYGASPSAYIGKDNGTLSPALGAVTENSISTPTSLTVTPTGTTGSTTYGYRVSALNGYGETLACTEVTTTTGNATLSGTNYNALNWASVTGASTYNVYGRTSGSELKLHNVSTSNYHDTGADTPSGALPTTNTTSGGWYSVAGNSTDRNTVGPCKFTLVATGCNVADAIVDIVPNDPWAAKQPATLDAADVTGALPANTTQFAGAAVVLDANNVPSVNADDIGGVAITADPSGFLSVNVAYISGNLANSDGSVNLTAYESRVALSGLAQSWGNNTIGLQSGSTINDFYNGMLVKIVSGTGAGQARQITGYAYNGAGPTYTVTVGRPWTTNPDGTSKYAVTYADIPIESIFCSVSASPVPTATVFASASLTSGTNYANSFIVFRSGANKGAPARKIASVTGTTITLGTALPSAPASGDIFELIGYGGI